MRLLHQTSLLAAVLLTGAASLVAPRAHAAGTYLALGDSYAYGYQNSTSTPPILPPLSAGSNGDQGYVSLFADFLGQRDGGGRPTVVNLARPGETSGSYTSLNTSPIVFNGGPVNFNTNYAAGNFSQSQSALLTQRIGGGLAPQYVTVQLGGNDILGALFADPTTVPAAFNTLQTNYTAILGGVRAAFPTAEIYVVGYGNPFPGLPPASPFNTLETQATIAAAIQQSNQLFSVLAGGIGAKYVNLSDVFAGQEANLTNITTNDLNGQPNYHPNAAGYQAIGNRLAAAAAVPEAGTVGLLAAGSGGGLLLLGSARRRRRAGSALAS